MNERLEELIVAYLHRGITPEQERELFEACRDNPDIAALLRRHVTMSLKLRAVRERLEVPIETRNELLRRINELSAPAPRSEPAAAKTSRRFAFGFRHMLAGALGAAALTAILFAILTPAPGVDDNTDFAQTLAIPLKDTIEIIRADTVTLTRTVVRYSPQTNTDPSVTLFDQAVADNPDSKKTGRRDQSHAGGESAIADAGQVNQEFVPAAVVAELHTPSGPSWIEQYSMMLVQLETVQLSSRDRIRQ